MALRRSGSSTVSNAAMASTPKETCSSYKSLHCEFLHPSPLRRNSQRAPSFVISSTFRHGGRTSRCDYIAMAEWHECLGTDGSFRNGTRRDRMPTHEPVSSSIFQSRVHRSLRCCRVDSSPATSRALTEEGRYGLSNGSVAGLPIDRRVPCP